MIIAELISRTAGVTVTDGGGAGIRAHEIGHHFLAHVLGCRVAVPEIVKGKSPGRTAGIVVILVRAVQGSGGRINPIRRKPVVVVPVIILIVGIGFHRVPLGIAGETLEGRVIRRCHVARVSPVARVEIITAFGAISIGVIGQHVVDVRSGGRAEPVTWPAFFALDESQGNVVIPVRGRVVLVVIGAVDAPVHQVPVVQMAQHEIHQLQENVVIRIQVGGHQHAVTLALGIGPGTAGCVSNPDRGRAAIRCEKILFVDPVKRNRIGRVIARRHDAIAVSPCRVGG